MVKSQGSGLTLGSTRHLMYSLRALLSSPSDQAPQAHGTLSSGHNKKTFSPSRISNIHRWKSSPNRLHY
ncbi:hypothetical protein IGI04_031739 [Brassica rapa subsp. trilocularis]|uniref:Uncharacterized protein n=1 Tax=Brassica rapa subsp. trilocularis TaxID=1813537 RepID=A0ABQ7LUF4_BRACM|nr:hypothetical protein IGI04_031739 [Brassica rapa subsp. trilocularis]